MIRQTERKEDKITHGGDSSTNCIIFDIVMEVFKGSVQGHNPSFYKYEYLVVTDTLILDTN